MSVVEIRLPALSATMESAILHKWLVSEGAEVSEGQAIAEVGTDKVDMEFESPHAGTITERVADEGSEVALGGVLALIDTEAEDLLGGLTLDGDGSVETEPAAVEQAPPSVKDDTPPTRIILADPPARKLAGELGVDLATVKATGRRGQVTSADVRTVADGGPQSEPQSDERKIANRRATASIMEASAAIPQFTLYRTVDLTTANERRAGLGWTTVLVRALAAGLRQHPEMRPGSDPEVVRVGIAVDRPDLGLTVVSIPGPDRLDRDLANEEVRGVVDRARSNRVRPEDMAPAQTTLSNLGGLGIDRFNALLFPPQASILSAGTIRHRPIATGDGALKVALTVELGLTVDHRVADGADGARFLETVVDALGG